MSTPASDLDDLLHTARLLAVRLERLSADSLWARRASGLRGALLRHLEQYETASSTPVNQEGQPASQSAEQVAELAQIVAHGFAILRKAAQEIRTLEDSNFYRR
jgi:hypothetical protein